MRRQEAQEREGYTFPLACTPCPLNTFLPPPPFPRPAATCTPCPLNTFSAVDGSLSCTSW